MATPQHVPVMLDRCVELLSPALGDDAIAIDGTLGLGGHAEALLERCPELRLVGIDRDTDALALASDRLARFGDRFIAFHGTYDQISEALARVGAERAHGVLLDLGVSSMQLDEESRGFAYAHDAPLDMRMNAEDPTTAAELVNGSSADELRRIFSDYGEERYSGRIAKAIVAARESAPLERSEQLVDIIRGAIPAAARHAPGHPGKRVFQALRIAVNDELGILERTLPNVLNNLAVGGRVVVMAYHSLEDRAVKQAFAAGATSQAPLGLPVIPADDRPYLTHLTRGAERPSAEEITANPRSASVRLRAAKRIRDGRAGGGAA